jgi:hypothetical protein
MSASPPAAVDGLRVAVSAYPGRFKGASRQHSASDLNVYLTWCAARGPDLAEPGRLRPGRPSGLLGLQIFEATGLNIDDLRDEHGRVDRSVADRSAGRSVTLPPPLLDFGSHHGSEPDRQWDGQPDHSGDPELCPLLSGGGRVEEGSLGVVEVDPGLYVAEPVL